MFFTDFLKSAAPPDDAVTLDFIERVVPRMLERYVTMSAKGGTHQDDTALDALTIQKFEAKNDQSMCTHLLNGIFPSLRLMYLLEREDIEYFSSIERRVYIVSYMMHDIDKIDHRPVETKTHEDIERSKARILHELKESNISDFFPDVADYLEDITFLVVNTQQRWNTHLNTYLWRFRLPERRIALLRRFCTYSDQIAYLVTSPSDISLAGDLADILKDVSRNALIFRYHQLRDVRGLFTSVVNNGIVNLMTENKQREGIWPYLFFSNGVVYIARKTLSLSFTTEQIVESVTTQLRKVCGNRIKHDAPGFKFSIQGIAKHPDYYFEFLTLDDYLSLLATSIIQRTANDITATPFEKLTQMQRNGEIDAPLPDDVRPDRRASILSRFFSVTFVTILNLLDKAHEAERIQAEQELVTHLGLTPYWERAKFIPNKGGVEYRWFWLAAWYLHDHRGLDIYGEGSLSALFEGIFALLQARIGDALREGMQQKQKYLRYLPTYLAASVELNTSMESEATLPDFYAELEGYSNAKNTKKVKGKKLICTLCNSEYPTEEHSDNAVLFQPWVYKNKLPLYANENAGGFCTICALELMLRQLLQKGSLRLTGGKFEAMKTKYIAVYPNYFFTAETGAMVQDILLQLTNINFFTLKRELTGKQLTVHDVLNSSMFESLPQSESSQSDRPVSLEDYDNMPDEDNEELGEGEDEVSNGTNGNNSRDATKASSDSGYIKYEYPEGSYPGMCLFGMKAGKDDNDSASWAMPALLALALPLATGAKVVISEMLLPLYSSGEEFQETVVFDAPHTYLSRLLNGTRPQQHKNRVRVNAVLDRLSLLVQVYQVNLETYAKGGKPEWKHLVAITRDLETDPMYIFSYLRRQDRIQSQYAGRNYISLYLHVCHDLLNSTIRETMLDMHEKEKDLGNIQRCVELYSTFYRGDFKASHSILKPVDIVAKAIINSPLEIDDDDLLWQIQGEVKNWLDRVRSHQAVGRAIFWGKDIGTQEEPAIRAFVTYFYQQVFKTYCQGERGILRNRLNRFKDGCEAYYVHLFSKQFSDEQEHVQTQEMQEAGV